MIRLEIKTICVCTHLYIDSHANTHTCKHIHPNILSSHIIAPSRVVSPNFVNYVLANKVFWHDMYHYLQALLDLEFSIPVVQMQFKDLIH